MIYSDILARWLLRCAGGIRWDRRFLHAFAITFLGFHSTVAFVVTLLLIQHFAFYVLASNFRQEEFCAIDSDNLAFAAGIVIAILFSLIPGILLMVYAKRISNTVDHWLFGRRERVGL